MFRCQLCQRLVPPRTPCHRLVLTSRYAAYPYRFRANVVIRRRLKDKKLRKQHRDDPGGGGQEIVREVTACPDCADKNGRA
jgi:hypothetical protein